MCVYFYIKILSQRQKIYFTQVFVTNITTDIQTKFAVLHLCTVILNSYACVAVKWTKRYKVR